MCSRAFKIQADISRNSVASQIGSIYKNGISQSFCIRWWRYQSFCKSADGKIFRRWKFAIRGPAKKTCMHFVHNTFCLFLPTWCSVKGKSHTCVRGTTNENKATALCCWTFKNILGFSVTITHTKENVLSIPVASREFIVKFPI